MYSTPLRVFIDLKRVTPSAENHQMHHCFTRQYAVCRRSEGIIGEDVEIQYICQWSDSEADCDLESRKGS